MKSIYLSTFWGFLFLIYGCQKEKELKLEPVISWENPEDITYGTLLSEIQLNASANVPGVFVYIPEAGTKLDEGENQELRVNFSPADSTIYNNASKKVRINVLPQTELTDIDGNVYATVTIGTQVWMLENLKTTKYRNGDPITHITNNIEWKNATEGAYSYFNNVQANADKYGNFYNLYAVKDSRNIAPQGWHVANNDDWEKLEQYVSSYPGESKNIAKALSSKTDWETTVASDAIGNNLDLNNSSGFTALPSGFRNFSGTFANFSLDAQWWSLTTDNSIIERSRSLHYTNKELRIIDHCNKEYGFTVRCVKD